MSHDSPTSMRFGSIFKCGFVHKLFMYMQTLPTHLITTQPWIPGAERASSMTLVNNTTLYTFDCRALAFNPFSPSTRMHFPPAITVSNPNPSTSSITPSSKLPGCNHTCLIPLSFASFRLLLVTWGGVRKLSDVVDGDSKAEMLFTTGRDSI